ncbi:MAG: hypothetical protein H0U53_06490 [Actinobacteria bacterium]|nr:hypothetical protein [Actinomycetota bacterium]
MPQTGDMCEQSGTFIDDHGHEVIVAHGQPFPQCEKGYTWWWHEDLPIAKQMRHEWRRPPRPGGLRDLIRDRMTKQGCSEAEIEEALKNVT